jgi:hypothetical protein
MVLQLLWLLRAIWELDWTAISDRRANHIRLNMPASGLKVAPSYLDSSFQVHWYPTNFLASAIVSHSRRDRKRNKPTVL